jgi:hypothetical protein
MPSALDEAIERAAKLIEDGTPPRQVLRAFAHALTQAARAAASQAQARCGGCNQTMTLCARCSAKQFVGGMLMDQVMGLGSGFVPPPAQPEAPQPPINVGRVQGKPVRRGR